MLSCPMPCLGSSCQMPCRTRFHSSCSSCWCCCCLLSPFPTWCRSSGRPCSVESRQSFGLSRLCRIAYRCCSQKNRRPATDRGCSRTSRWMRRCPASRPAGFAIDQCCPRRARSCVTTESARDARPDPHRRW